MATEFQNAINLSGSAIGVSYQNKFLGENFGNYARTKTISLRGTLDFRSSNTDNDGVKEALSSYAQIASSAHNASNITINGHNFGTGKIVSLDFSERENPVRIGAYSAEIEIYETGNLSPELTARPLDDVNRIYAGLDSLLDTPMGSDVQFYHNQLIESITENFDFEDSEDGGRHHSHTLNVQFNNPLGSHDFTDSNYPFTNVAQSLAEQILNGANFDATEPGFSFLIPNLSVYDDSDNQAQKYLYDETIDLVNLQFSFSKKSRHHLQGRLTDDFTFNSSHTVTLEQGGFITITENGQVKSRKGLSTEPENGLNTYILPSAYANCNAKLSSFVGDGTASTMGGVGTYSTPVFDPLYSQYITLSRTKQPKIGAIDYSVTFTNNPKYTSDGIHEFTITINESMSDGTASITEDGTIRPYGLKDKNFDATTQVGNIINNSNGSSSTRVINALIVYLTNNPSTTIHSGNTISQTSTSVSYPRYGKSVSYNCNYTVDGTYLTLAQRAAAGICKVDVDVSDNAPTLITRNYTIPNHKEIVQEGYQTSIGTRDISVTAQLHRSGNYLTSPPTGASLKTQLDYLVNIALAKVYLIPQDYGNILIKEIFISDYNYDFNSKEGVLSLNLQASFTARALHQLNAITQTKHK